MRNGDGNMSGTEDGVSWSEAEPQLPVIPSCLGRLAVLGIFPRHQVPKPNSALGL